MDLGSTASSESRFSTYVEGLVSVIGHSDQAGPLRDYCVGLLMPGDRKSVEPMAAITAPERNVAQHQSLLHFVADAPWSDERVLTKVREMVQPAIERGGPIEAWIIDDTGFPKKGEHSVGVARQYCGQLGKQDNCQAAVSLSIAYRLYLTVEWAADAARRKKARVPKDIEFQTKPEIALEQIRAACEAGIARGVVLMDAGYGANTELRTGISALGLTYVAGILPQTKVWAATTALCRAKQKSRRRRPPKRARRDAELQRISVKDLALSLPKRAWRKIRWREGTADWLSSRFARVRVRAAPSNDKLAESRPEEWLLIEWPKGEDAPTKYCMSTLLEDITFERLVDTAQLRSCIERDYQELKQEGWAWALRRPRMAGFPSSRHAVHCGLRIPGLREGDDSPSGPRSSAPFAQPAVPAGYRPRGTVDPARASHP
jgi:SRSO17 transposase